MGSSSLVSRRVWIVAVMVALAIPFCMAGIYSWWRADRLAALEAGSGLVLVPEGVMEFAERGDDGPVVVVIHGSPGGYDQGLAYGRELLKRGCRVLSPSRPGYLRTPLTTGASFEEQADAIASMIRSRGITSCSVLGISEGSPCAMQLASRHPEMVTSLVLLGPPGESPRPFKALASLGYRLLHDLTGDLGCWWLALREHWDPRGVAADIAATGSSLPPSRRMALAGCAMTDPEQREFVRDLLLGITPLVPREHGIINDNAQLKDLPDPKREPITCPLLVLRGENDSETPLASVQKRLSTIPGATLSIVPEAGHLVPMGRDFGRDWDRIASFLKSGGTPPVFNTK